MRTWLYEQQIVPSSLPSSGLGGPKKGWKKVPRPRLKSHLNHQGRHVGSLDECSRGHLLDEELDEELCNPATAHVDEGINQQQIPEHP